MHELPQLPYEYNALEPFFDEQTMRIHHTKHHATYVQKLNDALQGLPDLQKLTVEELLNRIDDVPSDKKQAVKNHGGGHANHMLFWTILGKDGARQPAGELADAISASFGSFEKFKEEFSAKATTHFGSGWAWLVADAAGKLKLMTTLNQDSPLMNDHTPILGLDVWEHAYYLKYQNKRPEYIAAFWNVVDWGAVGRRFERLTD